MTRSFYEMLFMEKMADGEVTVCGQGEIEIHLGIHAKHAKAEFSDECPPRTGCNQAAEDSISVKAEGVSLILLYNTSEVRTVKWIAKT